MIITGAWDNCAAEGEVSDFLNLLNPGWHMKSSSRLAAF